MIRRPRGGEAGRPAVQRVERGPRAAAQVGAWAAEWEAAEVATRAARVEPPAAVVGRRAAPGGPVEPAPVGRAAPREPGGPAEPAPVERAAPREPRAKRAAADRAAPLAKAEPGAESSIRDRRPTLQPMSRRRRPCAVMLRPARARHFP